MPEDLSSSSPASPPLGGFRARRGKRRDRHGRGFRSDLIPPHLPGYVTRREVFDSLVSEAVQHHVERFPRQLEHVRVHVEDVPPASRPSRGEPDIIVGRCIPADHQSPARVIVYRRPIETRTPDPQDRPRMIRQVLSEQFGALLGIPAEDVDPDAWR